MLFGICCDAKAMPFPLYEVAFCACLLCLGKVLLASNDCIPENLVNIPWGCSCNKQVSGNNFLPS
jgi:hypothetical protein